MNLHEMRELMTVSKTAFAILIVALALIAAIILLVVQLIAQRYFAKCDIPDRRKKVLTWLSVLTVLLLIFTAVFSPVLYEIAYTAAVRAPNASNKTVLPAAIKITMYFALSMGFLITTLFLVITYARKKHDPFFTTNAVTKLAIFSALSVVLYLFVKFPLPFMFPQFLDIQISDVPVLLAGFMMGPQAGAVVLVIRALIKMPFTGTGGVGELGDLMLGMAFMLSSSLIYRRLRTKKGALIALIVGAVCCVAVSVVVNRYILIPFFAALYSWQAVLGMVRSLYPNVTQANFYNYFLTLATVPFNTLRCILVVLATFFLYKPTKLAFRFQDRKKRAPGQ
ncbi:MAG: ECF transporter S component [Firmicutes bacterium]|nr:ECF transporter S component [Bacillota bacterium]